MESSDVEREVEQLLAKHEAGDIDNVFDIVEQVMDLNDRLPRSSSLRPRWDAFVAICQEAMHAGS